MVIKKDSTEVHTPLDLHELYWAAGFIEGEGSFLLSRNTVRVNAVQVQREPLERLLRLFGGNISAKKIKPPCQQAYNWDLCGPNAAGLMMTLWTIMSPRRKSQIERALDFWKSRKPSGRECMKISGRCSRGHLMTPENTVRTPTKDWKSCRICRDAGYARWREKFKQDAERVELERRNRRVKYRSRVFVRKIMCTNH